MTRGLRNHNPGNIRISTVKYTGEITPSQDKAFKQFENMAWGYRAIFMLLYTYQKKYGLNTVRQMINRYAPPVENQTDKYVDFVSRESHVSPDTSITATNRDVMVPIVAAISRMENGVPAAMADVNEGWRLFVGSL